ncbi:hypothetical protein Tco_1354967 [Tanacetum coccineum]
MADIKTKTTMKEFVTENRANYYLGITSITVNGKVPYELKGKFLDDLCDNAFSGTNGEDAVEHIEYFFKNFDPLNLPNTYDEYKDDCIYEWNEDVPWVHEKLWTNNGVWKELAPVEHYCESFSFKSGHSEWPTSLEDGKLKDEALYNKAIMEEYEEEQEDKERCELHDDLAQEPQNCKIRRYEMIKYSFGQNKEYVAIKEYEYDDLTRTNKDACHAYQEIFRNMDEGWLVTRAE